MRANLEAALRAKRAAEQSAEDAAARINELTTINANLSSIRAKLEQELSSYAADYEEATKELKLADDRAQKAQAELKHTVDILHEEQERIVKIESIKKALEIEIKNLTIRLEEVETNALVSSKRIISKLEARVRDIELELDEERRRHAETTKILRKKERQIKEVIIQGEEDHKNVALLQDSVEKLTQKLNVYKRQLQEQLLILTVETDKLESSSAMALNKQDYKLEKLKALRNRRFEAQKLNHQEVIAEDKRSKLPVNWEAKKARADWLIKNEQSKIEAEASGVDYDHKKLLVIGADEADRRQKRVKKKNPDTGFADFEQATIRQHHRLVTSNLSKPNMEAYETMKQELGDAFYAESNTIVQGLHKDKPENIDRMVDDLQKQIGKRDKYSRRRRHDDDAEIDYINERNMRFNKKLDRFYGEYTTEIKQNLERGTAI
nr:EOG090X0ECA [Macrothrix elegans]